MQRPRDVPMRTVGAWLVEAKPNLVAKALGCGVAAGGLSPHPLGRIVGMGLCLLIQAQLLRNSPFVSIICFVSAWVSYLTAWLLLPSVGCGNIQLGFQRIQRTRGKRAFKVVFCCSSCYDILNLCRNFYLITCLRNQLLKGMTSKLKTYFRMLSLPHLST